jgi:hypothetical protein
MAIESTALDVTRSACKNFRIQAFECYLKAKQKRPARNFQARRIELSYTKCFRLIGAKETIEVTASFD